MEIVVVFTNITGTPSQALISAVGMHLSEKMSRFVLETFIE
jgi:hypothetical protein